MSALASKPAWMDWAETRTLIKALTKHSEQIRFVGGCVRDAVLARPVQDVDLATSIKPDTVMGLLKAAGITVVPTGLKHGTVTAVIGRRNFEITTLRRDVHTDGRHADVLFTENWQEDASRRDFTMNALYLSFDGELTDFFKGSEDARAGRVCFIGDPDARIKEDYLRILRFFRFFAHYGKEAADERALAACGRHAHEMGRLSGERIQHEMLKLFSAVNPVPALLLMQKQMVLLAILSGTPDLAPLERLMTIERMTKEQAEAETRLAILLTGSSLEMIADRWKLSGATQEILSRLLEFLPKITASLPIAQQKKLMRRIGLSPFKQLVLMSWAKDKNTALAREHFEPMLALADEWVPPVFMISGKDLKKLGYAEGKQMGDMLRKLEDEWETSNYTLTRHELLEGAKL